MKRILSIQLMAIFMVFNGTVALAQMPDNTDTVSMLAGYAYEVYYSMENGVIQTNPRDQWDIAFRTMKRSSSIITNDGMDVVLYTYPNADTSGWASLDTNGISGWKPMYNDPTDWENGAFSRNAGVHPDYGWAKYNEITHDLVGDSLFVIKLHDGSYRKLWIIKKYSSADIFYFRYARIDGSEEHYQTQDLSGFTDKNFYGYSIVDNAPVDFEPLMADWDILFTRYMSEQSDGSPYFVTGVLSNPDIRSKRFHPFPLTYNDFGPGSWDSTRSSIGWDWKDFDMNTFTYQIVDSNVYFIRAQNGDYYKLHFTGFEGSTSGLISLVREKIAGAGFQGDNNLKASLSVYPNPVHDYIFYTLTTRQSEDISVFLSDLSGRQLKSDHPGKLAEGINQFKMDLSGLNPGIYFLSVESSTFKNVSKIIIQR